MDTNNNLSGFDKQSKADANNNIDTRKSIYKKDIIMMYKPRPRRIVQSVIKQFVIEHNNLPSTKLKTNLRGHTIPYCVYKKIVEFFEIN